MSTATTIEWTQVTWNPVTGCDTISPGCDHCYARTLTKRLKAMGNPKYQNDGHPLTSGPGFAVTCHPGALLEPLRWRKPRLVFVNSMSDLFHARVPDEFLAAAFEVMYATPQHTYQVLTKRPRRMRVLATDRFRAMRHVAARDLGLETAWRGSWDTPNVWLGASVESAAYAWRADVLRDIPAAVRFVSAEPLLGPLSDLDLTGISWVIIGGESGPGARPMDLEWARQIIRQCRASGTAPFVKQLGSAAGRAAGAGPKGSRWEHWPEDLKVREFPAAGPGNRSATPAPGSGTWTPSQREAMP
jgi:protein gp37